jgi:CheY-like chemotaxis protein
MGHSAFAGRSILVVEAEPFTARCLRILLEGAGAKVRGAESAAKALQLFAGEKLAAAVLDYAGSAKDGHLLPEGLTLRDIPFVFCTDVPRDDAWSRAPALNKPVLGAELIEILRRLLSRGTDEAAVSVAASD